MIGMGRQDVAGNNAAVAGLANAAVAVLAGLTVEPVTGWPDCCCCCC
jgi:hypothetical protein